jgi:hypothetical protein
MQQTALDQWLRKKFIFINRVYCNTLPQSLPFGLTVEEAPEESGGRYLYKLSTRSERVLEDISQQLEDENIIFTSRVEDRDTPFNWLFNHPHKSFTYRAMWTLIAIGGAIFSLSGMPQKVWAMLTEEEVEEELVEKREEDNRVYHVDEQMFELDRQKLK